MGYPGEDRIPTKVSGQKEANILLICHLPEESKNFIEAHACACVALKKTKISLYYSHHVYFMGAKYETVPYKRYPLEYSSPKTL